jgi:hypothetical protein
MEAWTFPLSAQHALLDPAQSGSLLTASSMPKSGDSQQKKVTKSGSFLFPK